ncbi:peptidylprolyl isomerase [Parenemella sanctibonifatiensis]|nr:peptidylprolyl isomerase [Parenemella sanctibonifatiensis]
MGSFMRWMLVAFATVVVVPLTACGVVPNVEEPQAQIDCEYRAAGEPARPVDPPPSSGVRMTGQSVVALEMSMGTLSIIMDRQHAPCAVNSFDSLAQQGFYDNTECHRLVNEGIFILQCGDPTGTGTGGPGYEFDDELTGDETYPAGTVAMANGGPDTNGSQFFLVFEDSPLPPNYVVLGQMDQGSVAALYRMIYAGHEGDGGEGRPINPVQILSVTAG